MADLWEFDGVTRLATGAVGEPGRRTFYIQVRADDTVLSIKCEKQQVATISAHLRNLLKDLPEPAGPAPDASFVLDPSMADFVLGTVGLGYDRSGGRIFLQFDEMRFDDDRDDDDDDDDDDLFDGESLLDDSPDADRVRLFVSPSQAVAFCDQADRAVAGGRETCQWCGTPKDPGGHACPRFN
jgi:uncharacterized repeat protein (TIGR03847 family)